MHMIGVPLLTHSLTDSVQTPRDVYNKIMEEGTYNVRYVRVPTTPEKPLKPQQFDSLLKILEKADPGTHVVFNDQMGGILLELIARITHEIGGRSTTGLVIACLTRGIDSIPPVHGPPTLLGEKEQEMVR